ncbi:MAG: hypothetical protein ACXW2E_00985 [Nitrososphaeraceae archaeon]
MKFTNETLLEHYLADLKLPDTTHGYRPKSRHPEYWKFVPVYRTSPIKIDPFESDRNIWFWSDTHFNHKNIIKYSGRPFPNTELMNKCLIGNYINVVKENDIVFWGGDITFGHIGEMNRILTQLPGYKIHILGNHDIDNNGKQLHLMMDERRPCYVIDVIDADIEFQLLITHYPLDNVPNGCFSVHGHIHQHLLQPFNFNMCVEHTNYTPINITNIIKKAKDYLKGHE